MRNRKTILILIIALVCVWGIYQFGVAFAPGSYPYAETYEVNASEQDVIQAVKQLKTDHPELLPPQYLTDGRKDSSDLWYHIYFFNPNTKQILYTWTRPVDKKTTTFAFISVSKGSGWGDWVDIKDLSGSEKSAVIETFEQQILNNIKQRIKSDRSAYNTSLLP